MRNIFILFVSVAIILTSCSSSINKAMTSEFYSNSGLTYSDIQKIQFYISQDIILERSIKNKTTELRDGKLIILTDGDAENVIIPAGTKGIVVFQPKDDQIGVCFDQKDESKFLMFGPNPKYNNKYCLLASEWQKDHGIITYGTQEYRTTAVNASTFLILKIDKKNFKNHNRKVEKGRSL